jgi:hypothetical protein
VKESVTALSGVTPDPCLKLVNPGIPPRRDFLIASPLCLRLKKPLPSAAVTQKLLFPEGHSLSRAEKQATDEGFNRLRKN